MTDVHQPLSCHDSIARRRAEPFARIASALCVATALAACSSTPAATGSSPTTGAVGGAPGTAAPSGGAAGKTASPGSTSLPGSGSAPGSTGAAGKIGTTVGTAGSGSAPAASGGSAAPAGGAAGGASASTAGTGSTQPSAGGAPAPADIEDCYELRAHGQPTTTDTTPYAVPMGETYTSFIFKAPWTKPVQGIRFRNLPDNVQALHHWLMYKENNATTEGTIEACELAGPTGFACGQASGRALITGWAPGRPEFLMPEGVGLELPAPGELIAVEFHHYNYAMTPATDRSGVEVCVTSKFRAQTASISWLGTQNIAVPASSKADSSGVCTPLRKGMNATDPIHVIFSWPHMHKLGRHLKSVVNRADGTMETLHDKPFDFNYQTAYETPLLLMPGDKVTTTCSFENTTQAAVAFGQSTTQEMCYNFTYAWPAHALDNPGATIGGADNTCLQ